MITKAANGYYMPSYFFIHIDSDEELDTIISNNSQTFAHEYIHFLQDLVLPYCIRANLTAISQLSCINTYAIENKDVIRPFDQWNEDCLITRRQLAYTWGDSRFIESVDEIRDIHKNYFTIPTGQNVYKYSVDIGSIEYQIGARDLLEYIAHKIESKHWIMNTYDFPYRTVDKLFEFYGLSDIPIGVRLCIVEYCLYNDNPINMFLELFINQEIINKNKDVFLSYSKCKEFLLGMGWLSRGNFKESIFSKTKRRLDDFTIWLSNQYKHKQFSDIKKWVNFVTEYTEKFLSNRFILSELYELDSEEFTKNINTICSDLGVPLLFNNKLEFASMLPIEYEMEQFIQFYVMLKFMDYIESDEDGCPVADFCKANLNLFRKECLIDPLTNIEKQTMCPFLLFIKSYGFDQANIINSKWTK